MRLLLFLLILPLAAKAPTLNLLTLSWSYGGNLDAVQFEVAHSTDLISFELLSTNITTTLVQVLADKPQDFFIVRARDIYSGEESVWNLP